MEDFKSAASAIPGCKRSVKMGSFSVSDDIFMAAGRAAV